MTDLLEMQTMTAQRQDLLTQALGGHTLTFQTFGFSSDSRQSLQAIGLTPIEITALEQANTGRTAVTIPTSRDDADKSNPWTKNGFNLTRQGEFTRTDPVRAEKLKAKAGQ